MDSSNPDSLAVLSSALNQTVSVPLKLDSADTAAHRNRPVLSLQRKSTEHLATEKDNAGDSESVQYGTR